MELNITLSYEIYRLGEEKASKHGSSSAAQWTRPIQPMVPAEPGEQLYDSDARDVKRTLAPSLRGSEGRSFLHGLCR